MKSCKRNAGNKKDFSHYILRMYKGDQKGGRPLTYKTLLANEEKVDVMELSLPALSRVGLMFIHPFTHLSQ